MKAIGYALLAFASLTTAASASTVSDPWADRVVSYTPGENLPTVFGSDPTEFFERSLSSLGSPSRQSGGAVVSPYSSPFTPEDIVSIGEGGSLTVEFDEPVTNDPLNPFGIDLLIFGNAFLTVPFELDFSVLPDAEVTNISAEPGVIEVSADGVTYFTVTGVDPDGLFPTNGYADSTDFFPTAPGAVEADFTLPVDPSYNPIGDTRQEVFAAYNGSGGGAGVDIGALGLSEISFVRISNPLGSGVTPEIDAFADVRAVQPVPEPAAAALALLALAAFGSRRP